MGELIIVRAMRAGGGRCTEWWNKLANCAKLSIRSTRLGGIHSSKWVQATCMVAIDYRCGKLPDDTGTSVQPFGTLPRSS